MEQTLKSGMEIVLNDGKKLDLSDKSIHKYWNSQNLYRGCVFIMVETVNSGYSGFAVLTSQPGGDKWFFFSKDTVKARGEETFIEGKFNNKPFIRISIDHADGSGDN